MSFSDTEARLRRIEDWLRETQMVTLPTLEDGINSFNQMMSMLGGMGEYQDTTPPPPAYTILIKVWSETGPRSGVSLRLFNSIGTQIGTGTTDAAGQCTFNPAAGTGNYAVTNTVVSGLTTFNTGLFGVVSGSVTTKEVIVWSTSTQIKVTDTMYGALNLASYTGSTGTWSQGTRTPISVAACGGCIADPLITMAHTYVTGSERYFENVQWNGTCVRFSGGTTTSGSDWILQPGATWFPLNLVYKSSGSDAIMNKLYCGIGQVTVQKN